MKKFLCGASLAVLVVGVGCSDYAGGNQVSSERNESGEQPNFGSATDLAWGDGSKRSTNELNAADNGIGGPPNREAGNYESQPLPGQRNDQELAKRVKVALTTGSLGTTGVIAADQTTQIQVQVQNGVVTLSGPVSSEQEKETITKRVAGMKGVSQVQNNLTVSPAQNQGLPLNPIVPRTPGNQ